MSKNVIIILSVTAVLMLLCCAVATGLAAWQLQPLLDDSELLTDLDLGGGTATPVPIIDREPVNTPVPDASTPDVNDSSAPDPTTAPTAEPAGDLAEANSTEAILTETILPPRDQRLLAMRLRNHGELIPEMVNDTPPVYELDQTDSFWVTDNGAQPPRQFEVPASLRYITDHSYWWVQDNMAVDLLDLERSANQFEQHTYPTNREFFGSEWSPGVDNDGRVHIFLGDVPGVAGYFSASNSYARQAEPYSNEREMFFINLRSMPPGNDYFDSVLAHEFQHMIHWHQDRNEDTWVNEGMSELSTYINGYGPGSFMGSYTAVPDTQLNSWGDTPGASVGHYGGSFLFMAYFLERYGEEMTKAVVATEQNGIAGFNHVLADNGYSERFDDIFADFITANYLNNASLEDGRWGYEGFSPGSVAREAQYSRYPVEKQTTVYQYGADYIELAGDGDLTIEFTGSTRVPVLDNQPYSGSYYWYSHRGDDSNPRLTRTVDLSTVDSATLNYAIWYDIETDWDFGYVEVSIDGGETWQILETPHSSTDNFSGNAFGPGYTGLSDGWLEESIDLTPYTGQEVLLRFEYVTDDAVNSSGWTLDDISIPEIGFFDDVESGTNGWEAEGFVRIDNILPQRFLTRVLLLGDDVTVQPLPLDETNYGTLTVAGLGDRYDQAVLIVSGLTPVTTEPASYQYKITAD
jgi:immune inhibitor A